MFFDVIIFVLLFIIFFGIYHFFLALLACISSTQLLYTVEKTDTCTEMEVSFWWIQNKNTSKMKQKSVYWRLICIF